MPPADNDLFLGCGVCVARFVKCERSRIRDADEEVKDTVLGEGVKPAFSHSAGPDPNAWGATSQREAARFQGGGASLEPF